MPAHLVQGGSNVQGNTVKTECQLTEHEPNASTKLSASKTCPARNIRAKVQSVTEADQHLPLTLDTFSPCLVGLGGGGPGCAVASRVLRVVLALLAVPFVPRLCLCLLAARLGAFGAVLCVCFWLVSACVLLPVLGPSFAFCVFPVFSAVFSGFGFSRSSEGIVKKCSRTSSHGLKFFSPGFLVVSIPG